MEEEKDKTKKEIKEKKKAYIENIANIFGLLRRNLIVAPLEKRISLFKEGKHTKRNELCYSL